jgi:hypothetical protein
MQLNEQIDEVGVVDEVVPVNPEDAQSVDFLIHHPAFQSLSRIWHWDAKEGGNAYIVHLKSLSLGSYYTRANINPKVVVQEALQWLTDQEKDLGNST